MFHKVYSGFYSLKGSPSELWKAYVLKFLDSFSYFAFSLIFTLFLSSDFGFSDIKAGTIYGAWGALITIYGLMTGFIIDNLGVARSLRIGFFIALISRIWILMTTSRAVLLFNTLFLLPLGNCLGIPVLTIGIRRYTTEENRGFAFGLFYVVMNVAALFSGPLVDLCTILIEGGTTAEGEGQQVDDNNNDDELVAVWKFSGYRAVILTGIIANAIACLVTLSIREIKIAEKGGNMSDDDNGNDNENEKSEKNGQIVFKPKKANPMQIFKETTRSKNFWKFLLVCVITLNVRMIFRHLDATLPKYMVREFGEKVPKGTIYSINPALICVLVPIVTAMTTAVDPLVMIHAGSYISALSVFFLAFSTSIGASIAFIVCLSVGEAVWSPRLYDFTMSFVKEGREGTFMALSSAPLFLAKLPVGFMSGYLLQKYCPDEGERHSRKMWAIIGFVTLTSPILLTLCWKCISDRNDDSCDLCGATADNEIDTEPARAEQARPLNGKSIEMPQVYESIDDHVRDNPPLT